MGNNQRRNGGGDFHDFLLWLNCELVVARSTISLFGSESTLATVEFESLSKFLFRFKSSHEFQFGNGRSWNNICFMDEFSCGRNGPGGSFLSLKHRTSQH
jgi:hypothetical protein